MARCHYGLNAGPFIKAIAKLCDDSLKDLAITIDTFYGDVINGASSFNLYFALSCLETDRRWEVDKRVGCVQKFQKARSHGQKKTAIFG